jgi:5-carboxymethyl-2-hydroxymuconic-semialdehyde dehydrogenase
MIHPTSNTPSQPPTPALHKPTEDATSANRTLADAYIAELASSCLPHLIGGVVRLSADGRTTENYSPVDGHVLHRTARGGPAEIDAAAQVAAEAFEDWRQWPAGRRRDVLHAIADRLEASSEKIALLETADTGQPLRFTGKTATRGAENFRYFADLCSRAADGGAYPTPTHMNYTMREAIGPVGIITPWNMPFMLGTWKIAPALAAGCTVVHKPAEWSPLTASLLAEVALGAGLPAGVLNVVHGLGEEAGGALTQHPQIKAIGFVGGTRTGSQIMAQGAPTLKRVHFELGGKSPVVVFDDADFERALDAVSFMIFSLNGQRCNAGSRLLVQRSIHDRFVERLVQRARSIRVGDPFDPATEVGPLIHGRQLSRVSDYCAKAQHDGATIHCGGTKTSRADLPSSGHWFSPTIVSGVKSSMEIARDEVFGPVLAVMPFDDEADALALANDSRYGLSTYLWTGNLGRAHRLARSFQSGMVWVNTEISRNLSTPFGGMKDSGIGRDGGDWSFDFYMETRNVCIGLDTHKIPKIGKD